MGKRKLKQNHSDADELEILKKHLHRARNKGDFKEVSNLHNQIGVVYRELQLYEEAINEHEEEARITQRYFPDDKVGLGVAFRAKAEVYLEIKENEKALPLIKEYLRLSKEANDLLEEQRAHTTLGRVYLALAIKYAEDGSSDEAKSKVLDKAEREFGTARDLCNHTRVKSQQTECGLIDMKCGVIFNIAIVLDMKGNTEDSLRYTLKTIELAKQNSFHEHLYRGNVQLYEIYMKQKKYKQARDAAVDAAKAGKALDNFTLEAECRIMEAKMYLVSNEIELGITVLKKVRKQIKTKEIAQPVLCSLDPLLKAAVRIVRTEDKLHLLGAHEFEKRRELYECMADNYVEIGSYADAVTNYELAVRNAESAGTDSTELAKLYYSLAITFKDMGDEVNALKYFQKEIDLHDGNPVEAFKTQTNITFCMEKVGIPQEQTIAAHHKAISLGKKCECPKKEIASLNNFSVYLKSISRDEESEATLQKIREIRIQYKLSEDSEDVDSQDLLDSETGENEEHDKDSVDLDHLTTDDESTDEEDDKEQRSNVAVQKKRNFRVNEKGETPLHVAAKKGDIKTLRRLIRQGHEINPRDSAGWIPLHEACNFGNTEVVEELIKHGARIDDQPGGKDCDKIAPIHDAANNGHLDVMKVLIDRGANVLVKDAHGNYPIDCIIVCRERVKASGELVTEEELERYHEIKALLKKLMAEAGKPYQKLDEKKARKKAKIDVDESPKFELMHSSRSRHETPIPVKVTVDDFDPDDGNDAVDLYSETIFGLRGKNKQQRKPRHYTDDEDDDQPISPPETRNALISESQYVDDDWLEDDMGGAGKRNKRKRDPLTVDSDEGDRDRYEFSRLRPNNRPLSFTDLPSTSTTNSNKKIVHVESDEDDIQEVSRFPRLTSRPLLVSSSDLTSSLISSRTNKPKKKGRVIQTKIPFKRVSSSSLSVGDSSDSASIPRNETLQVKSTRESTSSTTNVNSVLRLKIQIGDKAFVVPVLQSQLDATIDWLCEECSRRYFEANGLRPVLTLSTKDGAILSGTDIIRVVLSGNETELMATVMSFDLPRLPERFKSAVAKVPDLDYEDELLRALETCQSSNVLNLTDQVLKDQVAQVIFKSLQCQFTLRELHLSACSLHDEGVNSLSTVIPTLPGLVVLDLSCNGITSGGLSKLSESLRKKPENLPMDRPQLCLTSLNLSYNSIGNSAGPVLTDLLCHLTQLRQLFIVDCDFTARILSETRLANAFSRLKLDELDISYNEWGRNGLEIIRKSLSPLIPTTLTCTCCGNEDDDDFMGLL